MDGIVERREEKVMMVKMGWTWSQAAAFSQPCCGQPQRWAGDGYSWGDVCMSRVVIGRV
jgi:hypothetical protein